MGVITKQEVYIADAPATYRDFSGGINTSLSNEVLQDNEIRDGLNTHYSNDTLINRRGAKLLQQLVLPINDRPQGDFLFAAPNNDYIISVRNGHIFYGEYPTGGVTSINMSLLLVDIERTEKLNDPENYVIGLETYTEIPDGEFEGFIYSFNPTQGIGDEEEEEEGSEDSNVETLIIQNYKRVEGIPVEDFFLIATGTRILKITEVEDKDTLTRSLHAEILKAYQPNAWEYQNIGVNNLSPFPNYFVKEEGKAPKTQLGFIMTDPQELDLEMSEFNANAIVTPAQGYTKEDFYYKWEVKINDSLWNTIWYWNASKNSGGGSSKGAYNITINKSVLETVKGTELEADDEVLIRCALTSDFGQTYNITTQTYTKELDEDGDFVANRALGESSTTHVTKKVVEKFEPTARDADQEFYNQHSSTKVVADGRKAIFYDDMYNTGEWYKTVVKNYNYITHSGNLNFKTTKNETIVGVVVYDTNIIVFADNPKLGGNISLVTGNGDDYNDGEYFSPYKRKIVNTSVSCDAYNTIQVADNYIMFKYRDDIFMLDTNSLTNSDSVQVTTVNDPIKQRLNNIEMPLNRVREPYDDEHITYDFHELKKMLKPDEIFSEVVDGYYGLIFPYQGFHTDMITIPKITEKEYEGGDPLLQGKRIENVWLKPGLRWKCYYRNGKLYQNKSKEAFPWLRDVSSLFDIVSVLYIEGKPCFVRKNGDLITFDDPAGINYDGSKFKLRIRTKGFDMELPSLSKFLDGLNIYYNRDFNDILYMTTRVYNESGYLIYGPKNEAYITTNFGEEDQVRYGERISFDDAMTIEDIQNNLGKYDNTPYIDAIDRPVMILNEYKGIEAVDGTPDAWEVPVLDRPSYTSKTLTPRWRFPFLSAGVDVEVEVNQGFSLSSLTFNYTSSDMPEFTREKLYRDILRENALD